MWRSVTTTPEIRVDLTGDRNPLVQARHFRTWLVGLFRKRGVAARSYLAEHGNRRGWSSEGDIEVDDRWKGAVKIKTVQSKTGFVRRLLAGNDFAIIKDGRGAGPLVVMELDLFLSLVAGRVRADHREVPVDGGSADRKERRFDIRL